MNAPHSRRPRRRLRLPDGRPAKRSLSPRPPWYVLLLTPRIALTAIALLATVGFVWNAVIAERYTTALYPAAAHPWDYYAEIYLLLGSVAGIILALAIRDRETPGVRRKTGLAPFVWEQLRGRAKPRRSSRHTRVSRRRPWRRG